MAYEKKLEKMGKLAAAIGAVTTADADLRIEAINSEDHEQEGFRVVIVVKYEPRGVNDIL